MRLYLSSFRLGDSPEELLRLVGQNTRTAVVFNAADACGPGDRRERLDQEVARLRSAGLDPEELDLREYFGRHDGPQTLLARLRSFGLVWVRGGNAFVLRKAATASGFDLAISELLDQDALVYGGYSAGVCLLAPSLAGIELCDDPEETPDGYEDLARRDDGLGVLPYAVAPHLRTPTHPETALVDRVVEWFLEHRVPFVALRDRDVIVQDGEVPRVLIGQGSDR